MRMIGCDLHARQQALAMLETTTGETVNLILVHEGNNVKLKLPRNRSEDLCGADPT